MAWSDAARQAAAEARRRRKRAGKLPGRKTGGQRGRGTKKRGIVTRPKKVLRPGLKRNAAGRVVKDTNTSRVAKRRSQLKARKGAYRTSAARKPRKLVGAKTPKRAGATGAMKRRRAKR